VTSTKNIAKLRRSATAIFLACVAGVFAVSVTTGAAAQSPDPNASQAPSASPLVIENESPLPDTFPHAPFQLRMLAHGGVPVLHWRIEKGALPQGIKLDDNGLLHGAAERTGEFTFTVSVKDGNSPQQAVQKEFVLRVRSGLSVTWKTAAHVNGNRIDGSVVVSNVTADDLDLTYVVMAVAGNGRATAIGYQRFNLTRGTIDKELPFGETLPHGGYVIHVDVVGEVASKNLIYHERLQTPSQLQVTVGP
jgi:hypothetical protein